MYAQMTINTTGRGHHHPLHPLHPEFPRLWNPVSRKLNASCQTFFEKEPCDYRALFQTRSDLSVELHNVAAQ